MNPYDLEEAIMKAWQTSNDLEMFFKHYGDSPSPMTEDEVANMIYGIKQIHDMRMEHLFDMYRAQFKLDEYCDDPEVLAERKRVLKTLTKLTPKKKGKKDV
jgi:hypothetical protein